MLQASRSLVEVFMPVHGDGDCFRSTIVFFNTRRASQTVIRITAIVRSTDDVLVSPEVSDALELSEL